MEVSLGDRGFGIWFLVIRCGFVILADDVGNW